jgi:hypothetical protein
MEHIHRASLSRIARWDQFEIEPLPRKAWACGDYVVGKVIVAPAPQVMVELTNGRMASVDVGDGILGAFGERYATLEATATWRAIEEEGLMSAATAAGLFGHITSISPFLAKPIKTRYRGHVLVDGYKATMSGATPSGPERPFTTPVLLIIGSSMSAGKTSSARIIIRRFRQLGLEVLGAKLTGAGRYRDILAMGDAGAEPIYDFVDAGLPSTVCDEQSYRVAIRGLLSRMAEAETDVAVVEAGASPLEPYNGEAVTDLLKANLRMTVLCASDPYAVVGMMNAFGLKPDLIAGIACNTEAGMALIDKLTGLPALRLTDPQALPVLDELLRERFMY